MLATTLQYSQLYASAIPFSYVPPCSPSRPPGPLPCPTVPNLATSQRRASTGHSRSTPLPLTTPRPKRLTGMMTCSSAMQTIHQPNDHTTTMYVISLHHPYQPNRSDGFQSFPSPADHFPPRLELYPTSPTYFLLGQKKVFPSFSPMISTRYLIGITFATRTIDKSRVASSNPIATVCLALIVSLVRGESVASPALRWVA